MPDDKVIKSRPMPINEKTEVFIEEWKHCILDDNSNTTNLFLMVEPFFGHWERQLKRQDKNEHINYSTLYQL